MVTVAINRTLVSSEQASEGWINRTIAAARSRQAAICIQVRVETNRAKISFATPECPGGYGAPREWNSAERQLIDAWTKRGLTGGEISPGQLQAFLNDVEQLG